MLFCVKERKQRRVCECSRGKVEKTTCGVFLFIVINEEKWILLESIIYIYIEREHARTETTNKVIIRYHLALIVCALMACKVRQREGAQTGLGPS